jgi:hypothetical protein
MEPTSNAMPKPDHVLSFATDQDGSQLFIHADANGLDYLIRSLTRIRRKLDEDVCDHDHLMTDAWAGSELSERSMPDAVHLIHHVKIYGWTPALIKKHGLSE